MTSFLIVSLFLYASISISLPTPTPSQRASLLLSHLTLSQKILLLHGANTDYVGATAAIPNLIPALYLNDGPQGFRAENASTTQFPSALTIAATWDGQMIYQYGKAIAEEFRRKGANVYLGPGVNVARVPLNGRNFEYVSGEDPYLGSVLVKSLINGIQSQNVCAVVKHWVLNNQETDRTIDSSNVDEKTRYEIYYPPFAAALESNVCSVMCSYNKIYNTWSCENELTLNDLKTKNAGGNTTFNGWVMSDWGATHSLSLKQGLDQEMPGSEFFNEDAILLAIKMGTLLESDIDNSVLRILTPMFAVGIFDNPSTGNINNDATSPEHTMLARRFTSASTILLQNNNNLLPIDNTKSFKILFVGSAAELYPFTHGEGSGVVYAKNIVSPFKGVHSYLLIQGNTKKCTQPVPTAGLYAYYGTSVSASSLTVCMEQCVSADNCLFYSYNPNSMNCMMSSYAVDMPASGYSSGTCPSSTEWECNDKKQCVTVTDGSDLEVLNEYLEVADYVIVAVGTTSSEGYDRTNLSLANGQDELIQYIATQIGTTKLIVDVAAPGAALLPWKTSVSSILYSLMAGQEFGSGLADIIFGDVNPSAKLPITIPNIENEENFQLYQYPGVNLQSNYTEGPFFGYRWYSSKLVNPSFCFGYGLSYSTYEYSNLTVTQSGSIVDDIVVTVTISITNTGAMSGMDVVQLYLITPDEYNMPIQLKGFAKSDYLDPTEEEILSFQLIGRDFAYWDVPSSSWKIEHGLPFIINIGSSVCQFQLLAKIAF